MTAFLNDGTDGSIEASEALLDALVSVEAHLTFWGRLREKDLEKLAAARDPDHRARVEEWIADAEACISALSEERDALLRRRELGLVVAREARSPAAD